MKYLLAIILLSLTGCGTVVPVAAKFPDVPEQLMTICPPLVRLEGENITLSNLTRTVVANYTTYYECAVKNDSWAEWYQMQKQIFEEANK